MYKKILMPVDIFEMDLSDKAIRHAVYLAGESGEITLLNVLPNSNRSILRGFASDIKKFEDYMQSESAKKMKNLQRLFDMPAERIHTEVRFGNIRDEVLALSKTGLVPVREGSQRICWDRTRSLFYVTPIFQRWLFVKKKAFNIEGLFITLR